MTEDGFCEGETRSDHYGYVWPCSRHARWLVRAPSWEPAAGQRVCWQHRDMLAREWPGLVVQPIDGEA